MNIQTKRHPDILHKIFQNCDHCPPLQRIGETHDLLSEVSVPHLTKASKMKKIKLKWRKQNKGGGGKIFFLKNKQTIRYSSERMKWN